MKSVVVSAEGYFIVFQDGRTPRHPFEAVLGKVGSKNYLPLGVLGLDEYPPIPTVLRDLDRWMRTRLREVKVPEDVINALGQAMYQPNALLEVLDES